jgi:hypothetical protein
MFQAYCIGWLLGFILGLLLGLGPPQADAKARLRDFRPPPYTKTEDLEARWLLPQFMRPDCPKGDLFVWNESALGSAVGLCVIRKDI